MRPGWRWGRPLPPSLGDLFGRRRSPCFCLDEMPLEVAHRGKLKRSLARFSLDRAVGEDPVIGPGRRIAADDARRPLRLFWRLEDRFDRLERGQVAGAIDVDRAVFLASGLAHVFE